MRKQVQDVVSEEPSDTVVVKDPKDIGLLIRRTRRQAGLRQAETAALCGVGTRFLSDMENGKPTLQIGKAIRVMKSLGLQVTVRRTRFDGA